MTLARFLAVPAVLLGVACGRGAPPTLAPAAGPRCDTVTVGGTVRGVLVFEPTGQPVAGRGVYAGAFFCHTVTDANGHFTLRRLPPGTWDLHVGALGYRRFKPVPVVVKADSVTQVRLALQPENMLADCLEQPSCHDLLVPPPHVATDDDSTQLQLGGYRVAIAFAGSEGRGRVVACIDRAPSAVLAALIRRYRFAVPGSECDSPAGMPLKPRRVVEHGSGRGGFAVGPSRIEIHGDTAIVHTSYYVDPLWALGWRCRFVRQGGGWEPQWCGMEWIS